MSTPSILTEPVYTATTERLYRRLPDHYRRADADNEWVFKRWLSGIVDQQGQVEDLATRFDYTALYEQDFEDRTRSTGENIVVQAEAFDRQSGPWYSSTVGTVTYYQTDTGPAFIEKQVFLIGGTYTLDARLRTGPTMGRAYIAIDRAYETIIEQYASVSSVKTVQVFNADDVMVLGRGYHTIRYEWTGSKSDAATDDVVGADYFRLVNLVANASDTSDLVDPNAANNEWLDWLAQLVGVTLPVGLSEAERRDAVRYASAGFKAGTKRAVADAAKSELTGTRYAQVYDHSNASQNLYTAGEWDVLVVTRASETPSGAAVVDAITRKGAKPAGVVLYHRAYQASWDVLEAQRTTWNQWDAASWTQIEETGLA